MDIQSRIREAVSDTIKHDNTFDSPDQINGDQLLDLLKQKGVVDEVLSKMQFEQRSSMPLQNGKPATHFINKEEKFVPASSQIKRGAVLGKSMRW